MKFITRTLLKDPDFNSLINGIKKNRLPILSTGLSQIHKAAVIAGFFDAEIRKIAVITESEAAACELAADTASMGLKSLVFPARDYCIGNMAGYSKEYEHKRTDTLSALADGAFDLLCLSVDAAVQYTVPKEILQNATFTLHQGDTIDTSVLTERLIMAGYVKSELCEGAGQFSQRGGIFDIFHNIAKSLQNRVLGR